ncbi:MAG: DNA polymerase III subunit gamma/tau [Candidatus Gastranaerophilales bacterium]|nr:DNA polymerase III subunit gamma/tau [Candidatus Gastranaerophilales bacterium]
MGSSYIPLYRKYRPQQFKDLVGQEAISRTLSNAIELNKVAHAYLFTGPRGTGKTSTARIFAKSLNCQEGPTLEPCGVCPSCIDIASGNAIDVIEIDAASNRKVEDARNLLEKVQFVPVAGKYKVYIIDEVHMLTTEAFNTLLKTLEEPPANLVFILATTEAHKVLNTIISRCQRFDFRRIKQDLIVERIKYICSIEKLHIDDSAMNLIARRASGGMRDALSLLDQVSILATLNEKVTDKDILNLLGSLQEDTLLKLVESIADKDTTGLLSILNEIVQLGNEPVQIIRELMNYFRNLMLVKTSENIDEIKTLIDVSEQFYEGLKKQSEKFDAAEIPQIIEKLSEHEKTLKTASQQSLWLEVALISICHRQDIKVIKDLEARISKLEEAVSGGNIQVSIPKVNYPVEMPKQETVKVQSVAVIKESFSSTTDIISKVQKEIVSQGVKLENQEINTVSSSFNSEDLSSNWSKLLGNIDSIPTRSLFSDIAKPIEISSEKIILAFANDMYLKLAQGKTKIAPFEKAAQKLFGTTPNIVFRQGKLEETKNVTSKKHSVPAADVIQPIKKENFEQISQDFEEIPKKQVSKVVIAETPQSSIDEDIIEEIKISEKSIQEISLPENAKMIKDLFQGKVIE